MSVTSPASFRVRRIAGRSAGLRSIRGTILEASHEPERGASVRAGRESEAAEAVAVAERTAVAVSRGLSAGSTRPRIETPSNSPQGVLMGGSLGTSLAEWSIACELTLLAGAAPGTWVARGSWSAWCGPSDARRQAPHKHPGDPVRTTLSPTLDIIFKLLFEARESREALISLLTAVLRPARPIVEVRVLNPGIRGDRVDDKFIVLDILGAAR